MAYRSQTGTGKDCLDRIVTGSHFIVTYDAQTSSRRCVLHAAVSTSQLSHALPVTLPAPLGSLGVGILLGSWLRVEGHVSARARRQEPAQHAGVTRAAGRAHAGVGRVTVLAVRCGLQGLLLVR